MRGIGNVFSALSSLMAGWKGYALIATAAYALGAHNGWTVRDWKAGKDAAVAAEARAEAAERMAERTQVAAVVTEQVGQEVEAAQARVRVEYRTIIERIPVYVTAEADRRVDVPVGFVRLHDAAAAGNAATLPDRPGQSTDAPSGVALSAVAGTVAGNYARCLAWREQVIGWQRWYEEQREAWDAPDP